MINRITRCVTQWFGEPSWFCECVNPIGSGPRADGVQPYLEICTRCGGFLYRVIRDDDPVLRELKESAGMTAAEAGEKIRRFSAYLQGKDKDD